MTGENVAVNWCNAYRNPLEKKYYSIADRIWTAATAAGFSFGVFIYHEDVIRSGSHKLNLGSACGMGAAVGIVTAACAFPVAMYWPIAIPPIVVIGGLSMIDVSLKSKR